MDRKQQAAALPAPFGRTVKVPIDVLIEYLQLHGIEVERYDERRNQLVCRPVHPIQEGVSDENENDEGYPG
jgi:hypothetical protein